MRNSDRNLLVGLLIGAGVGAASALMLDPGLRSRVRGVLREGAEAFADRLAELTDRKGVKGNPRIERAGRTMQTRIEKMRSAGL